MANWKNREDYPPENSDAALFVVEFARRDPDVGIDPDHRFWWRVERGVAIDPNIIAFSNALMPAHASYGQTLGEAQRFHLHISIDLSLPVDETMRKVEILVRSQQRRAIKSGMTLRKSSKLKPNKLVEYLRIFDAKNETPKVDARVIAHVLGPTVKDVNNGLGVAKKLIAGGYADLQLIKPV